MKEVLVHIGMHKTGSTSIQRALRGYKDRKTRYASFDRVNHSIPVYTMFSRHRYTYHIWRDRGFTGKQIDSRRAAYFKVLKSDLNDEKFERLIISGEDISALDADEKRQFVDCLKAENIDVKILMFTRSPLEMAASCISEYIKTGMNQLEVYNIDYKSRIDPFLEMLTSENVMVENYDELVMGKKSVVDRFSQIANVKIVSDGVSNQSLSIQAIALLYHLNRMPLIVLGDRRRMRIRKTILEKITQTFSLDKGFCKPDLEVFRYGIGRSAQAECKYLFDHFGIFYESGFPDPDPDPGRMIGHFDRSLAGYDLEIADLFASLGTEYDPGRSFEDNFTEAFFNLSSGRSLFAMASDAGNYLKKLSLG